jgi:hypothetical protein
MDTPTTAVSAPDLLDEEHDTTDAPPPQPALDDLHLTELLFWAGRHTDPDMRALGETVRHGVKTLVERRGKDKELAELAGQAAELERRLAEIRLRQRELVPPRPAAKKRGTGPDVARVRAWARAAGLPVPDRGRIPAEIWEAWRTRTTDAA